MPGIGRADPSSELQIAAPNQRADTTDLIDLLCKTFSSGIGYWNAEKACRNGYLLKSNYDWNASRIGKLNGEMVTHFGIWNFEIRVGLARLRVAGIGAVATHDDYRKLGLMQATATVALAELSNSDYDISLLFGIPNFYEPFGFRRAWNLTFATIEVDQIPSGPTPGRLHRTRSSTGSELDALYNKENANLTGTAVHPTFPLRNPFVKGDLFVWRQGQELKGYALVSSPGNVLEVKGWVGDPNELLTVVRSLATQRGVKSVQFQWIHCQSELARLLRQKTCAVRTDYRGSGGAMVRVISLQRSLTRLKPELENRLRRSDLSDWCGDLLLDNNREAVTLLINQGDVQVVAASRSKNSMSGGEAIAQLILGTDDPNETVAIGGVKVRGAASALLPVLFPNEYPALGSWDRF